MFFNPFLNLLLLLYAVLGNNFGLAVIAMAILIRLILLPSTKKQMKMTQGMADMKPKLAEIQKKYKDNPEMLAKEQMRLYKESGYSPTGCLTSIVPQMLILFAIFGVIRTLAAQDFSGVYEPVANFVFPDGNYELENLHFLIWDLDKSFMSFPDLPFYAPERWPYILLAAMVGIVQYLSTYFTQKFTEIGRVRSASQSGPDSQMSTDEMMLQMNKSMITIFPLMTAYLAISQPAVLGVYWFTQSFTLVMQYVIIDKRRSKAAYNEIINSIKKRFNIPFTEVVYVPDESKSSKSKSSETPVVEAVKIEDGQTDTNNQAGQNSSGKKKSKSKKKKKKKNRR